MMSPMPSRQSLFLLASAATLACAALVSRVRRHRQPQLLLSGQAPNVQWTHETNVRAAASDAQAKILDEACASDAEIEAFAGTLMARPHVTRDDRADASTIVAASCSELNVRRRCTVCRALSY